MDITASIVLARPRSDVFDYLADARNDVDWRGDVQSSDVTSGSPGRVGASYDQRLVAMGNVLPVPVEAVALSPATELRFRSATPLGDSLTVLRLADADGGTRVEITTTAEVPPPMADMMRIPLTAAVERDLRSLRERLEGRAAPPSQPEPATALPPTDRSRVTFTVNLSPVHYARDGYRGILDDIQRCEDAGIDEITFSEHVVLTGDVEIPPPTSEWPEVISLMSAAAAVTHRIRLSTGIMLAALRPAPLLAKQIATLDHLSEGRVSFGVGASYLEGEYRAFGLPFERRGQLLTEVVAACRAMWAQPNGASFHGDLVRFDDVYLVPGPYRDGGPPLYFAGRFSRRNVDRIVRYGHGWLPNGPTQDMYRTESAELIAAFRAAGRDPADLVIQSMMPAVTPSGGMPVFGGEKADIDHGFERLDAALALNPYANQVGIGSRFFVADDHAEDVPDFIDRLGAGIARWRAG